MAIIKKTTYVSEAQANLIEQFRGKPNWNSFIAALIQQIEDAESAAFEVLDETTLETAVGVQLDGIGEVVGQPRQGRDDDTYRTVLIARIKINTSSGVIEEIIEILIAQEDSNAIEIIEYFPAAFTAEYTSPLTGDGQDIASILNTVRPAGVRGQLLWHTTVDTFQFSSTSSSETDSTKGFSNAAQTTGGQFASASEG